MSDSEAGSGRIGGNHVLRRAALIAALLFVTHPATASAGDYVINNCPAGPQGTPDQGPWAGSGGSWTGGGYKVGCGAGPGDWIGFYGDHLEPYSYAVQRLSAPQGTGITIRHATVWWKVYAAAGGSAVFGSVRTDGGEVIGFATPHDASQAPDQVSLGAGTRTLNLGAFCSTSASTGCDFGSSISVIEQVFGVQTTLHEDVPPDGSVTGGGLAGAGPDAGAQALAYDASDGASGVRRAELLVDGSVAATQDYAARCPSTSFAACPNQVSDSLSWNTSSVADGTHDVALRIWDAAGNPRLIGDHLVSVDNAGRMSPGGPGVVNGTAATRRARLVLGSRGVARAAVRFGKSELTLRGRLLNAAGGAIRDAVLEVYQRLDLAGAGFLAVTTVRTGADGSWSVAVPRGPSRVIRIGYRYASNDPQFDVQADVPQHVAAQLTLSATRHLRNGQSIVFRGALQGGYIPASGKLVELQVRIGRRWQDFDTVRTSASGSFSTRRRLTQTFGRVRYRFRAVARAESGYPYAFGTSHAVTVRVN